MKKKKIKSLRLNKKTVSNFQSGTVKGGGPTNSCFPDACLVEPTCTLEGDCGGGGGDITRFELTCINGPGAGCFETATACTFIDC